MLYLLMFGLFLIFIGKLVFEIKWSCLEGIYRFMHLFWKTETTKKKKKPI